VDVKCALRAQRPDERPLVKFVSLPLALGFGTMHDRNGIIQSRIHRDNDINLLNSFNSSTNTYIYRHPNISR